MRRPASISVLARSWFEARRGFVGTRSEAGRCQNFMPAQISWGPDRLSEKTSKTNRMTRCQRFKNDRSIRFRKIRAARTSRIFCSGQAKMNTLRELLIEIKRRPGMYIGHQSLTRLSSFIGGWLFGKVEVPDADILNGFQDWIAIKYHITSSHGWDDIILFFELDERSAFDRFWILFDEYLLISGKQPLGQPAK
jgi:hypothetical protein